MPASEIRIVNAREFEHALAQVRRDVFAEIRPALLDIAGKVADEAHRRAPDDISNVGDRWSQFRPGATIKGAYVAPKARRRRGSPRRNMGGLLLRVMEEAVDAKQDEALAEFDLLVSVSKRRAGF